jgi:hypothetical protein
MQTYPTLRFFTRHGEIIAAAVGLAVLAGALWLMLAYGFGWGMIVAGVIIGTVAAFLVMVFVELARIISEMMLPP